MKKFLFTVFVLIAAASIAAYFAISHLLTSSTRKFLPVAQQAAESVSVSIQQLTFDSAQIGSLKSARWKGFRGSGTFTPDGSATALPFSFSVGSLEAGLLNYSFDTLVITVQDADVQTGDGVKIHQAAGRSIEDRMSDLSNAELQIEHLQYVLPLGVARSQLLSPSSYRALAENTSRQLEAFLTQGKAPEQFEARGAIELTVSNKLHRVPFRTVQVGDAKRLELDREALQQTATASDTSFTDAEVDLIAGNPVKAPALLSVKYQAEVRADELYASGPEHDAFRVVYWSYLLSKSFGSTFAKRVTDAHEATGGTQPKAEREMDIVNAAIGRKYAERGLSVSQVEQTFKTDRSIAKTPRK